MLVVACNLLGSAPVHGQGTTPAERVAFEQKLDAQVPPELAFVDDSGAAVALGDYFGQGPIVLTLGYYECPMLCSLTRQGLEQSLSELPLEVGEDFQVIFVSIDPRETPMVAGNAKRLTLSRYNRPGSEAGWHFLTGSEAMIATLANTIGFRYFYDEELGQYAHSAGVMLLTPGGRLSHYFFGIEFNPSDLRLGLVEASASTIGTPIDQVLLLCYSYDPSLGKYNNVVMNALRIFGVMCVLGLALLLGLISRGRDPALRVPDNTTRPN